MRTFLLAFIILLVLFIAGCDDDNNDSTTAPAVDPFCDIVILMDGAPVDTLHITEENHGDVFPVLDGEDLLGEIKTMIRTFISEPPEEKKYTSFLALARKDGHYTNYHAISPSSIFQLDYITDFDAYDPETTCGTVIMGSDSTGFFRGLIKDYDMAIWSEDDSIGTIHVNDEGRFETDIAPGDYTVKMKSFDDIYYFDDTPFHLRNGYNEFYLPASTSEVCKPNIYLYPTEATTLDVSLEFPHGGMVTISDPQYPEKWQNIRVEPDGTIDGKYRYLFYEAETPTINQQSSGWVVARDDLEDFFAGNLRETGFIKSEIDDFIEWWIPRLTLSEYYAIYPQYNAQIDPIIAMKISQQPDNILRLAYYVDVIESPDIELQTPQIPDFERTGFVVTEWGLIPSEDLRIQLASE